MTTRCGRTAASAVGGLAVGVGATLLVAGPAAAKGPETVTVARPGEEAVELTSPSGEGGLEIVRLAEDLGIWEVTGDGAALLAAPPTRDLGEVLTIEWTMYNPMPADPEAAPGWSSRSTSTPRVGRWSTPLAASGSSART